MTSAVFTESHAIERLKEMYINGYISDDLDVFLNSNFEFDDNTCKA
jgi:hypothetical protein